MEQTGLQGTAAPAKKPTLFARFVRGRKGVVAIEFAMVAVPFIGLLAAIFETAFVFFVHEAFDNTVNNVARQILVNGFSSNTTPTAASFMTNTFCPNLPSFINCSLVTLNVQASQNLPANLPTTSWYNSPSANVNLGQPKWYVVFQAFYPMPVYLSVLVATGTSAQDVGNLYSHTSNSVYNNPNGSGFVHAIFSTVVFRNEP